MGTQGDAVGRDMAGATLLQGLGGMAVAEGGGPSDVPVGAWGRMWRADRRVGSFALAEDVGVEICEFGNVGV